MLPDRTDIAEDAFVQQWTESDDTDGLLDIITAAMDARRPRLAARLVGLLEDHVEIEPGSPIDRARAAARMVLMREVRPEDVSWSEFEDAWSEARRSRMNRLMRRQRQRLVGDASRIGRVSGSRRR